MTTIDTEALRARLADAAARGAWDEYKAIRYSDELLEASVAAGGYGIEIHPNQARELLRLATIEHRTRAAAEAQTLGNLIGGVPSGNYYRAVTDLLRLIADGREDEELYGERTAREYREREAELRKVTGDPSAIYYPRR